MVKRKADVCCIEKLDRTEQDFTLAPLNWHLLQYGSLIPF